MNAVGWRNGAWFHRGMTVPLERLPEILDHLGQLGLTCIVKIDGERSVAGERPWTVLVSGGPLQSDYVRREGNDLQSCFGNVLAELERRLARTFT